MPGMSGMQLLDKMAREHPEIPVLVISAHGTIETAIAAIEGGARGFIEKPFTPERIRSAVAYALDRKRQAEDVAEKYDEHIREASRLLGERQLDPAFEHARLALSADPTRPEAFNMMGVINQLRSERSEAQRFYMAALALDPSFRPAKRNQENLTRPPSQQKPGAYELE
jgi:DNA-binding response OmpR family regulator